MSAIGKGPNILYLTWGETIVNNGIYDNQVFELLKEIRCQSPTVDLTLLCGMPLINQRLIRHRAQFYSEVVTIEKQLRQAQVKLAYRWIPAVARWFHSQPYQFFFYTAGQRRFLHQFSRQRRIDIVHCRGYHATRLALQTRAKYKARFKVIFDTRGLFPEEGVYAGHYPATSQAFHKWKMVEKELLKQSDAIVNVSSTFTQHVETLTENPRVYTICTTTNIDVFRKRSGGREQVRQQLGIKQSTKVLVYLGSIGIDEGWHRIGTLIALYRAFRQAFSNTQLLIITRTPHGQLSEELSRHPDVETSCQLISSQTPDETAKYLAAADYGALPYRALTTNIEEKIGHTMIASKTGEYLAAGLPVLVNQSVGAATQLINERQTGCSYTLDKEDEIVEPLQKLNQQYADVKKRCINCAEDYFSSATNAIRYIEIYHMLCDLK